MYYYFLFIIKKKSFYIRLIKLISLFNKKKLNKHKLRKRYI
jgi:hypothetical protein